MDRYDYETLKGSLSKSSKRTDVLKTWFASMDSVLSVGRILADEYIITTAKDMLDFIEKPWHWEQEMRDLVVDYELERVASDIDKMTMDEATEALVWLDVFGYEDKALNALMNDLSERELCPV